MCIAIGLMRGPLQNLDWFPRLLGLSAQAPAADADRLGTSGQLQARRRCAGLSSGIYQTRSLRNLKTL